MVRYSDEFKHQVLQKMMSPARLTIAELGRQTDITVATLYYCQMVGGMSEVDM